MTGKKEKILSLIEGERSGWKKAAFYKDPVVSAIMERLYERWEKAGRQGIPLDYATEEEEDILYRLAEKYHRIPESKAMRMVLYDEKPEERKRKNLLRRLLMPW